MKNILCKRCQVQRGSGGLTGAHGCLWASVALKVTTTTLRLVSGRLWGESMQSHQCCCNCHETIGQGQGKKTEWHEQNRPSTFVCLMFNCLILCFFFFSSCIEIKLTLCCVSLRYPMWWFGTCIYCKIITIIALANTSITSHN